MKKLITGMLVAIAATVMISCNTKSEETPLKDLNGEWNITVINGEPIKLSDSQESPFVGFDVETGRMYGYAGCNRVMASFDKDSKPGELNLGSVGSGRMACPDLTLEHSILSALSDVKKFKKESEDQFVLCDENNKALLTLVKVPPFTISDLKGKWDIAEVNGEMVPTDLENQPFMEFDMQTKRIHGNAGCNIMNGEFKGDDLDPSLISFPGVITTMMSCPEMDLETKILNAVNSVQTFAKVADGVALYNADGQMVLVLRKAK